MISRRSFLPLAAAAPSWFYRGLLAASAAYAANAPGVSATEIKIGQTMPYSGPLSPFGVMGRAEAAYFRMINERGGVNGRTIDFISLDDAYSPSKTVEQTRRLVEQEGVAFMFGSLGGTTNLAVRQYLNDNKIPHLFLAAPAESVQDFTTPMLLPGITVNTSPTNYMPIRQFQPQRFNGENWELFGDVPSG
jgi:branched-chain amino acid transport system substrate-binding protein